MNGQHGLIIFLSVIALPLWADPDLSVSLVAPRIECDASHLERARGRIAIRQEPFFTYWNLARTAALDAANLQAAPYSGPDSLAFHGRAQDQGIAARLLAYQWRLEDNRAAGSKAVALLSSWAAAAPVPGSTFDAAIRFPNSGMDVARGMLPFVAAYDLLQGHPALTPEIDRQIQSWFRLLSDHVLQGMQRWEAHDDFGGQEFQNHHASHVLGLALFGSALRDPKLIELASHSPENPKDFQDVVAGLILMPGDPPHGGLRDKPLHAGEIQDRYRTNSGTGLIYCHLSLTLMLYSAEVLTRATGRDHLNWTAPGGETLRLPATFYSDFFRLRNASLHGDYYFRDAPSLRSPAPFLGLFEVALHHWPDTPNLKALVRSIPRAHTPRSWLSYYGLPLLTHGVDVP